MLRFELEPPDGGSGCVLRLTHLLTARDQAARDAAGWHVCLDGLELLLAGTPEAVRGIGVTPEWEAFYAEYERLGLPTGAPVPGMETGGVGVGRASR